MRVICPKCAATYEIPVRAIPLDGREVQCSACAHAWYQLPPAAPAPMTLSPEASGAAEAADAEASTDPHPSPRRKIDPEVLRVLRDEASFEAQARRKAGRGTLETQPDLGLPDPVRAKVGESVRERLARLKAAETTGGARTWAPGEDTVAPLRPAKPISEPADAPLPPPPGPKPDPEMPRPDPPTATPLRPSPRPAPTPRPKNIEQKTYGLPVALSRKDLAIIAEQQERRGFRWGFGLTAGFIAAAVALYLLSPLLRDLVPGGEPLLDAIASHGELVQSAVADALRSLLGRAEAPTSG